MSDDDLIRRGDAMAMVDAKLREFGFGVRGGRCDEMRAVINAIPQRETVFGCDLKVGDVIEGLVPEKLHRIVALKPYTGPLAYLFKDGASLASFDNLGTGMTIDHGATFRRVGGF